MEEISKVLLIGVGMLAAMLLFTPYESMLEGAIAFGLVAAVLVGFSLHPRREVFYVRTTVNRSAGHWALEHDYLAVKVELARLWLLFLPTFLAVAFLVFFAAGGPVKFSYLNWIFSSRFAYAGFALCQYPPLLVIILVYAWISERRVMREAEACSARSVSLSLARAGWVGRVSYLFMGEHGEYYGGDCMYFRLIHSSELATIVFHDVRKPELNKIATGFLFHRLIVLGRGIADLDKQTVDAQTVLAETSS
ncbi:MAG: hypothetical protein WBC67_12235 [Candidatus Acidiferrales bacterium]